MITVDNVTVSSLDCLDMSDHDAYISIKDMDLSLMCFEDCNSDIYVQNCILEGTSFSGCGSLSCTMSTVDVRCDGLFEIELDRCRDAYVEYNTDDGIISLENSNAVIVSDIENLMLWAEDFCEAIVNCPDTCLNVRRPENVYSLNGIVSECNVVPSRGILELTGD